MQPKIWFITGAARGFGRIWSEAALARGDKVAATARDAEALADLVDKYGDRVLALELDVTERERVFEAVRQARDHFGALDVVVSNAGYAYMGPAEDLDFNEVKANFETNVFGTLSVIQAVLPYLRKQGSGHIITLSSVGGIIGYPTGGSYIATKFAVEGMTESLAGEVAGFGIKVTIVEPGSYSTEFLSSVRRPDLSTPYEPIQAETHALFPPSSFGEPAATADAILALVDAEQPPLRFILGSTSLPAFKKLYAERLATWDRWAEMSNAAQGGES